MTELFKAPVTSAERVRDELLGALVGLARATTSEPKTDDTDEVLNAGLRLLAQQHPSGDRQTAVYQVLFTLAEDWDEALLLPVVQRAEELCGE